MGGSGGGAEYSRAIGRAFPPASPLGLQSMFYNNACMCRNRSEVTDVASADALPLPAAADHAARWVSSVFPREH